MLWGAVSFKALAGVGCCNHAHAGLSPRAARRPHRRRGEPRADVTAGTGSLSLFVERRSAKAALPKGSEPATLTPRPPPRPTQHRSAAESTKVASARAAG